MSGYITTRDQHISITKLYASFWNILGGGGRVSGAVQLIQISLEPPLDVYIYIIASLIFGKEVLDLLLAEFGIPGAYYAFPL